ncbi:MAG: alcohol dehydrogenase, partial [Calditrichaeota bacterium]
HEIGATVVATAADVEALSVGDRVAVEAAHHCGVCEWCLKGYTNLCPQVRFCGLPGVEGALREYMAWPAHLLYKLPPELDHTDAVLAEVIGIGLHALDLAHLRAGTTAAVLGAGPIGLGIIHLLRRTCGIHFIIGSEPVRERQAAALRFGADEVIDVQHEDVFQRVMTLTHGRGVDAVFDAAGVDETFEQAVKIAAPGGKVIVVGIPENDQHPFSASAARRKGLTFRFVRRSLHTYPRVFSLMQKGIIDVRSMVTHVMPFPRVSDAYDLVDNYQDGVIKAVISFDEI